jgi:hypothetical protein
MTKSTSATKNTIFAMPTAAPAIPKAQDAGDEGNDQKRNDKAQHVCAPHLKLPSNKLAITGAVPCAINQAWSGSFRGGNSNIPSTSKRVRTA